MPRTLDGVEWVNGRERRLPGVSPEGLALVVAVVVLLALLL